MATVWDMNQERKDRFKTRENTFDMFPVGSRVQIICVACDHHFFDGSEEGKVIRNENRYLSIIVEFDEPRHFEGGGIQKEFGFNPDDLILLEDGNSELTKNIIDGLPGIDWYGF